MFKVFYSWQSDLPNRTNRGLILNALEKACAGLKSEGGIAVEPIVDRDTLGRSGAPDISEAILAKIPQADAFVADVSIINDQPETAIRAVKQTGRVTPNPNVLVELGYALAKLGNEAIILTINTHYGDVDRLPFDLRGLRVLKYCARPCDELLAVKRELQQSFKRAINEIASVVRSDPVFSIVYPRTLQVAGQAEGLLSNLISSTGKAFVPETVDEQQLLELCRAINPYSDAPLVVGGNPAGGWQFADWVACLWNWRERSRKFTSETLLFAPFLDREHIALLASVEQCAYFACLESLKENRCSNSNLEFLSSMIWNYIRATRRLRDYARRVLARRAETF